MIEFDVV
jgi:hypothetical protein